MGKIVMKLSKKLTDDGTAWRIASHSCLNGIDQLPIAETTESMMTKPEFVDVDDFLTVDYENDGEEITYNRGDPLEEKSLDVSPFRMMEPTVLLHDCFSPNFFDKQAYLAAHKVRANNFNEKARFKDIEHEKPSFIYFKDVCHSLPSSNASIRFHRKPFTCDNCSSRFSQECNLKRHQKLAHARNASGSTGPKIFHSVFSRRLKLSSLMRYKTKFSNNDAFSTQSDQRSHQHSNLDDHEVRSNEDIMILSNFYN